MNNKKEEFLQAIKEIKEGNLDPIPKDKVGDLLNSKLTELHNRCILEDFKLMSKINAIDKNIINKVLSNSITKDLVVNDVKISYSNDDYFTITIEYVSDIYSEERFFVSENSFKVESGFIKHLIKECKK